MTDRKFCPIPQCRRCKRAPVAQRIRASDYGSEGRGFESSQALQTHLLDRIWIAMLSGMRQALKLAQQAGEKGEVPVGALLVSGDTLVAEAHNLRETCGSPIAHAEMLVIQAASQKIGDLAVH